MRPKTRVFGGSGPGGAFFHSKANRNLFGILVLGGRRTPGDGYVSCPVLLRTKDGYRSRSSRSLRVVVRSSSAGTMPASSKQPMSERQKESFLGKCCPANPKHAHSAELKALTDDERKARDNLLDKVLAGGCASTPCLPCSLSDRISPILVRASSGTML